MTDSLDSDSLTQVNSIFQQPWWLDAVAPGQWHEIIVRSGSEISARLPYVMKRRYGLTLLTMPQLTQTLGPWLRLSEAKYTNQLSQQLQLCDELIAKLPRHDFFRQSFSPIITNWLPFYWAGFSATISYTYRLEDLTDLDRIWTDLRENVRREIRKAENTLRVRDDLDVEAFLTIGNKTFMRQGMRVPYESSLVRRLDESCSRRRARRMLFAEDADGRIHAAIYLVWDATAVYYLLGGSDPALRSSGAISLLIWEGIKHAASVSACFDFEGSMIKPVERFFRAFGARQVPYFEVSRASGRMRVLLGASQMLGAARGRASRAMGHG